jgi:hypothetical protein
MIEAMKTTANWHKDFVEVKNPHKENEVVRFYFDQPKAKKQDGDCQQCGGKGCVACDAREQEPVAWMWRCKPYCDWPNWTVSIKRPADSGRDGNKRTEGYEDFPLYTLSPKREWVGLTAEQVVACWNLNGEQFWRNIEAKLKELNT